MLVSFSGRVVVERPHFVVRDYGPPKPSAECFLYGTPGCDIRFGRAVHPHRVRMGHSVDFVPVVPDEIPQRPGILNVPGASV